MATVYVEITDNYSRTVWDNTGATNYVIGDRVEYNDGSQNIVFVCITDNNSTTNPDANTSDWVKAGSEKYPFLVSSAISTNNLSNLDDTTSTIGEYALYSSGTNFAVEAAESQGEIILGDGEYRWTRTISASYFHPNFNNVNIKAKNRLKAYIRGNFTQYNNCAKAENLVLVNEYTPWNYVFGRSSATPSYLIGCLITQETPTFKLAPTKQESSSGNQSRPIRDLAEGSIIKNCIFDFSYLGPSFWFSISSTVITVENNTFYARVKNPQYNAIYNGGGAIFKNNIFYYKYLEDTLTDEDFHSGMTSQGTNILYVENPVSAAGGSIINNIPDGQTINPLFIDAENGNFSLRPSSPLIGGLKEQNELLKKYPNGLWVDHNHSAVYNNHNYSITGDGTGYTFTGDISGTDPIINALTKETLTFNNTGGHPLAIYNSQGELVASESSGVTTFTPKYPDTYYYQCTVDGHENMRGDIVIANGTLGSYDNPFTGYYDAIDAGYYDNTLTILFKTGDHELYHQAAASQNTQISSAFPGGLYFIGEDAGATRLTSENGTTVTHAAFSIGANLDTDKQFATPFYMENLGIHINCSGYIMRGFFSCVHWKSSSLTNCRITQEPASQIRSSPIDHDANDAPSGFSLTLEGCEMITAQQQGSFLMRGKITVFAESCAFVLPSSGLYNYSTFGTIQYLFGDIFTSESKFRNCIFYSDAGGEILSSTKVLPDVFSNCCFYSTTDSFTSSKIYGNANDRNLNNTMDNPDFLDLAQAGNENLALRPTSTLIGGIKTTETNVYYLQPGNPLNGDGSQKDASSMTTDGDPGPFNAFKNILAAGVPYGSKVVILNGTYSWPDELNVQKNTANWQDYTYEGYEYHAETKNEVIFDGLMAAENIGYYGYGGTSGAGVYLDLHTSFNGIQFNRSNNGLAWPTASTSIYSSTDIPGKGSCTFNSCKFLGWIVDGGYSWTGAARNRLSSSMHWKNCEIVIAFQTASGRLLSGEDGHARDTEDPNWSWENCVFYTPVGATTFYGINAVNGTYFSPQYIFGHLHEQTSRIFKNNILHFPGGNSTIGPNNVTKLPQINNNVFNGFNIESHLEDAIDNGNNFINIDPKFLNPENNNFKLRPNSLLIGGGI